MNGTAVAAVLDAARTGRLERTDFAQIPDARLAQMLRTGSPQTVLTIAAGWRRTSIGLDDAAESILAEYRRMSSGWSGAAAEEYRVAVEKLVTATRRVAELARRVEQLMFHAADSLELAQTMHPVGREAWAMSPVGVTPLAVTMKDLSAVYVTDTQSLAAVLAQVDTDVAGIRLPGAVVPAFDAIVTDVALRPAAVTGDARDALVALGSGSNATGGALQPYGGLLGDALLAGAAVLGGGAAAQTLAPEGIRFGPDGRAYRTEDVRHELHADGTPVWPGHASTGPRSPAPGPIPGEPHEPVLASPVVGQVSSSARPRHADGRGGSSAHSAQASEGGGTSVVVHVPELPDLPGLDASGAGAWASAGSHAVPTAYADAGTPLPQAPGGAGAPLAPTGSDAAPLGGVPLMGSPGGGNHDGQGHRRPAWLHESADVWGEDLPVTSPIIGQQPDASPLRAARLL